MRRDSVPVPILADLKSVLSRWADNVSSTTRCICSEGEPFRSLSGDESGSKSFSIIFDGLEIDDGVLAIFIMLVSSLYGASVDDVDVNVVSCVLTLS